jgi:hypothetical protein
MLETLKLEVNFICIFVFKEKNHLFLLIYLWNLHLVVYVYMQEMIMIDKE